MAKSKHIGSGFFATRMTDEELRAFCEEHGLDYEWALIKSLDAQGREDEARALIDKRMARKQAEDPEGKGLDEFLDCFK